MQNWSPQRQTSIFADETRLREDITEVYAAFANTEAAPNNLQLERVKSLRQKVDEAGQKNVQLANSMKKNQSSIGEGKPDQRRSENVKICKIPECRDFLILSVFEFL